MPQLNQFHLFVNKLKGFLNVRVTHQTFLNAIMKSLFFKGRTPWSCGILHLYNPGMLKGSNLATARSNRFNFFEIGGDGKWKHYSKHQSHVAPSNINRLLHKLYCVSKCRLKMVKKSSPQESQHKKSHCYLPDNTNSYYVAPSGTARKP